MEFIHTYLKSQLKFLFPFEFKLTSNIAQQEEFCFVGSTLVLEP